VKLENFLKIKERTHENVITPLTRNEMSHLRELVYHHHDSIFAPFGHRESNYEVRAHILPRIIGNRQQALMKLTVGHVTGRALGDHFTHIPSHLLPVKVFLKHVNSLVDTEMASQASTMNLLG